MFIFPFIIGIYSLSIFALGVLNLLKEPYLFLDSIVFLSIISIYFICKIRKNNFGILLILKKDRKSLFLCLLLLLMSGVNLIGVLGPEIGFDALWYHLVIPKIYIENHGIDFIKGTLLYYAELPRLGEMLYVPILAFFNEIGVKLIHFLFGIATCIILYRFSREFLKRNESIFVVIIFYSNLVVSWLSVSAYVDLMRSFFEICAVFYLYKFTVSKARKYIICSSILIGFAISTKVVSIFTLPFFIFILIFLSNRKKIRSKVEDIFLFLIFLVIVLFPWFLISYLHTGKYFYPIFENMIPNSYTLNYFMPSNVMKNLFNTFLSAQDPISPVYLVTLPLIIANFKSLLKKYSFLLIYFLLTLFLWYITPYAGSRFLVSYLPLYSLLVTVVISKYLSGFMKKFLYTLVILIFVTTIGYRMVANLRYIPYIMHQQTKQEFLITHLNFKFGEFYDINQDIKKIVGKNRVLVVDTHNLFYIDFPFDHITWRRFDYNYKYLLLQKDKVPTDLGNLKIIYINPITNAKLYEILK